MGQNVWLRLVEHLPSLREAAALPGWLTTTTRRACLRAQRGSWEREPQLSESDDIPADEESTQIDRMQIDAERNSALREGFRSLGPRCRDLLLMLMHDPPIAYSQISAELNIPVGSIGPSRARCLEKLRRSPVVAALGESSAVEGDA